MTQIVSCYLIFMIVCIQKPKYKRWIINRGPTSNVRHFQPSAWIDRELYCWKFYYRLLSRFCFVWGRLWRIVIAPLRSARINYSPFKRFAFLFSMPIGRLPWLMPPIYLKAFWRRREILTIIRGSLRALSVSASGRVDAQIKFLIRLILAHLK